MNGLVDHIMRFLRYQIAVTDMRIAFGVDLGDAAGRSQSHRGAAGRGSCPAIVDPNLPVSFRRLATESRQSALGHDRSGSNAPHFGRSSS